MPKKYIMWAAIAFVAFYLLSQPQGAASVVNSAASGLQSAANSLATFINALA